LSFTRKPGLQGPERNAAGVGISNKNDTPITIAVIKTTENPLPNGYTEMLVVGKIGSPTTARTLQNKYPSPTKVGLPNYDRYHIAGPNAAGTEEGIVYAPKNFNVSRTAEMENLLREARARVESAGGGDVFIEFRVIVKNWKEVDGVLIRVLKETEWTIESRLAGTDTFIPLISKLKSSLKPPPAFPKLFKDYVPGVAGFAFSVVGGYVHQQAVESRVETQVKRDGYVSFDAPSEKGLLYDIGAWLMDPFNDAEYSVGIDKRFNVKVWRDRLRGIAKAKQVGEQMEITWDVGLCGETVFLRQSIEKRKIIYSKQSDSTWTVVSGNNTGIPDLDFILSEKNSDDDILKLLLTDPCGA
jgi:hypothetical protein